VDDPTRDRKMLIVVWICVVMIILTTAVPVFYARRANSDIREDQIAACERGNLVRLRINDIAEAVGVGPPLRVNDCEELFR
jgi:hypothetical protein